MSMVSLDRRGHKGQKRTLLLPILPLNQGECCLGMGIIPLAEWQSKSVWPHSGQLMVAWGTLDPRQPELPHPSQVLLRPSSSSP